jgi:hypothetical protein
MHSLDTVAESPPQKNHSQTIRGCLVLNRAVLRGVDLMHLAAGIRLGTVARHRAGLLFTLQ